MSRIHRRSASRAPSTALKPPFKAQVGTSPPRRRPRSLPLKVYIGRGIVTGKSDAENRLAGGQIDLPPPASWSRDAPVRTEIPDDLTDHWGSLVSLKVISRVGSHLSTGFEEANGVSERGGPEEARIHSTYNGEDAFADELAGPVRRSGSSARRRRRAA